MSAGDLAFGAPFGMLQACRDAAPVAINHDEAMADYSKKKCEVQYIPAVQILNDRGTYSASLGVLPPWMRPLVKLHPWFRNGQQAVKLLAGIAVAAVAQRLTTPTDRVDLLGKLQEGRDDDGNLMGKPELTAEALTQLIAGSDTTSKCASLSHLLLDPADAPTTALPARLPIISRATLRSSASCSASSTRPSAPRTTPLRHSSK